jgi:hypothetical protein
LEQATTAEEVEAAEEAFIRVSEEQRYPSQETKLKLRFASSCT